MMNSGTDIEVIITKVKDILPLLIPILLIQWSLMIFALVKLFKSEQEPKYIPRWAWVLIIVFVNLIGSILYLTVGKNEE